MTSAPGAFLANDNKEQEKNMEKIYADPRKWTPAQVADAISNLAMYAQILSAAGRTEVSLSIADRHYYEGLATRTLEGLRQALVR